MLCNYAISPVPHTGLDPSFRSQSITKGIIAPLPSIDIRSLENTDRKCIVHSGGYRKSLQVEWPTQSHKYDWVLVHMVETPGKTLLPDFEQYKHAKTRTSSGQT